MFSTYGRLLSSLIYITFNSSPSAALAPYLLVHIPAHHFLSSWTSAPVSTRCLWTCWGKCLNFHSLSSVKHNQQTIVSLVCSRVLQKYSPKSSLCGHSWWAIWGLIPTIPLVFECLGMGVVISVMQTDCFLVKLNQPSYIALICAFNSLVGGGRGLDQLHRWCTPCGVD